jgi:hypothetical protein
MPSQATASRWTHSHRHRRVVYGKTELIASESHLRSNVDLILAAGRDKVLALGAEKRRSLTKRQARQKIKQLQRGDGLGAHRFCQSVGEANLTSHPRPTTDEMRTGSTILTSDSLATKVVRRMLLRLVLSIT